MLIFVPLLISQLLMAADRPECNAKNFTRNCAFFKERAELKNITLPDGTYYRNPLYNPSLGKTGEKSMGMGMDPAEAQKTMNKLLRNQATILDALDGVGLSSEFKLAYSQIAASRSAFPNFPLSLPWPPTEKGADSKVITDDELRTVLLKKLGKQKYENLQAALQPQKNEVEKAILAQKIVTQDQMKKFEELKEAQALEAENRNNRQSKIREISDYAKEKVEQIVARGKPESKWSVTERNLITKIRAIKVSDPKVAATSTSCANDVENAFYDPTNNTLNVCPGLTMRSDADLVEVISHEVGHSIDPCNFQKPLWYFHVDKLQALLKEPETAEDIKRELSGLQNLPSEAYLDPELFFSSKTLDLLKEKGVAQQAKESAAYADYPFQNEYNCLVKKSNFLEVTPDDAKNTIDYLARTKISEDPVQAQLTVQKYKDAMKKYPQCYNTASHSGQMGETMADVVGFLTQEAYLKENPPKTEEEKIGSQMFARQNCDSASDETSEEKSKENKKPKKSPEFLTPTFMSSVAFITRPTTHPVTTKRFDDIAMSLKGMSEIYDCRRVAPACLDHLSIANSKNSSQTENGRK